MTNKEKIKLVNKLLLEVKKDEYESDDYSISAFRFLEYTSACLVVDHWYTHLEPKIFMNDDGVEIDEYLCVDDYSF